MQATTAQHAIPRSLQLALFFTGCLWLLAAQTAATHGAQTLANRFNLPVLDSPLEQALFLFLLLAGFALLNWIATRHGSLRSTNALPARSTVREEFLRGAALGWGMLLAATLPLVFLGGLHPHFSLTAQSLGQALASLVTLALATLALEVAFRGYLYQRLLAAMGTTAATLLLSLLYALVASFHPNSTSLSFAVAFLAGIFFSIAYLRTHALWLGWGLHFAWAAVTGILFGLPVAGYTTYATLVQTDVSGPDWLTGGFYGPEGSILAAIVFLAAIPVLYRVTRDYAWNYTHAPIVAAGYPMTIAPPAAHVAMEESAAAAPVPLVQILGTTSTTASTLPVIDEHLRRPADDNAPVE